MIFSVSVINSVLQLFTISAFKKFSIAVFQYFSQRLPKNTKNLRRLPKFAKDWNIKFLNVLLIFKKHLIKFLFNMFSNNFLAHWARSLITNLVIFLHLINTIWHNIIIIKQYQVFPRIYNTRVWQSNICYCEKSLKGQFSREQIRINSAWLSCNRLEINFISKYRNLRCKHRYTIFFKGIVFF